MRLPELIEQTEKDNYVVTVSVFPSNIQGISIDIVIPSEEWQRQDPEEIAGRYLAAAIAAVKSHEGKLQLIG